MVHEGAVVLLVDRVVASIAAGLDVAAMIVVALLLVVVTEEATEEGEEGIHLTETAFASSGRSRTGVARLYTAYAAFFSRWIGW